MTCWRFLRDFWADLPFACGDSESEVVDNAAEAELEGPGPVRTRGIATGGGKEGWPGAVRSAIGYREPGSASGGASWTSGLVGEVENSSRSVDMGVRMAGLEVSRTKVW